MANNTRDTINKVIKEQLLTIVNQTDDYNFILTENVAKYESKAKPNDVFLVVSIGTGQMSYEKTIQSAKVNVVCNQNHAKDILDIMTNYCETFNARQTTRNNIFFIQNYNTPTANEQFIREGSGYGISCSFNASFMITSGVSPITSISINNTSIDFIEANLSYSNGQDAMIFPENIGTAQAPNYINAYSNVINQSATLILVVDLKFNYAVTFIQKLVDMARITGNENQNQNFSISITISGSDSPITLPVKGTNWNLQQRKLDIPCFRVVFTL